MTKLERPDKDVTITDISGKEIVFNARDMRHTEVIVNGQNRYFIHFDTGPVEIDSKEFYKVNLEVNGYKYHISKK